MKWMRSRSIAVGVTSVCYGASFPWGGWSPWLLQVFLSFMSDYVYTGRDSWVHVMDRLFASFHSIYFVSFAFATSARWWEILGLVFTFSFYFLSVYAIQSRNELLYRVGHTGWHLGSLNLVSVFRRNCDFIWKPQCQRRWVLFVFCDCASSGVPYVALALFAVGMALAIKIAWATTALEVRSAVIIQRFSRGYIARRRFHSALEKRLASERPSASENVT